MYMYMYIYIVCVVGIYVKPIVCVYVMKKSIMSRYILYIDLLKQNYYLFFSNMIMLMMHGQIYILWKNI